MRRASIITCILGGTFVLGAASAYGAAPTLINYQGRLTDALGQPLDTTVSMVFTIYDDEIPSVGTTKWAETLSTVMVTEGLFDVTLGTIYPLLDTVFNDTSRFLGIQVGADPELQPRTRLVSVGYAHRVSTVDGASGGSVSGDLQLSGWLTVGDAAGFSGHIDVTNGVLPTVQMMGGGGGAVVVSADDGVGTIALDGQYGIVYVTRSGAGGKLYLHGGGDSASYIDLYDPNDFNTAKILSTEDGVQGALIELYQANQEEGVIIDAEGGGGYGGGAITVYNSAGKITVGIDGDTDDDAAFLSLRDAIGNNKIWLDPDASGVLGAEIAMLEPGGSTRTVEIWASETGSDGGRITLFQSDGDKGIVMDGDEGGSYNGGNIYVFNGWGDTTVEIDGNEPDDAAAIRLWDNANHVAILLDGQSGASGGAFAAMYDYDGTKTVHIDASGTGAVEGGAQVSLIDNNGTTTISLDAESSVADGGAHISLGTGAGVTTIQFDADYASTGEGRVITSVLEITGGSDLSEQFEVRTDGDELRALPGMVVCIDPAHPGELVVSSRAYDPAVAGIISGAGGIKPGMLMSQAGSVSDGQYAVALTGRVYCLADATYGPIRPGDLLTTSDTPGHAMKVSDYRQAQGAILGKAMSALNEPTGLVLVLVSLQ